MVEISPLEAEKRYGKLLQGLRGKYGESNPMYVRKGPTEPPKFFELVRRDLGALEDAGMIRIEPATPGIRFPTPDPNAFKVTLSDKGLQLLTRTTTETTRTVTENFQVEEPQWKQSKRYRAFARTERGAAIASATPAAAASDVRGHIKAMARGDLSRAEWKARQIWLRYWLLHRSDDIPPSLIVEAEDYRDMPFTRRRNASKQAH